MKVDSLIDITSVDQGLLLFDKIVKQIQQMELLVRTQHGINTLDLSNLLRFKLGIAADDGYKGFRISSQSSPNRLSAPAVGIIGNRAGVDHIDIRLAVEGHYLIAGFLEVTPDR